MQVAHTLNNIIKILFNPTIEPFKLFDYLIVKSNEDRYIAQIIELYDDKFDASQNVAKLRLFYKISANNEVMPFDNFTPNRECEILKIKQEEVDDFINQDKKTFIFATNAKTSNALNLQLDFIKNNALILADKVEQSSLISLNLAKKLSDDKPVVIIDSTGMLEMQDAHKIKAPKDFKIPLNYETIDFIFDKCLADASLEFQQIVGSIVNEIKKFAKKQEGEFIPFNAFTRVLLEQYKATPYTELKLLLVRLRRYQLDELYVRTKKENKILSNSLKSNKITILDVSSLDSYWQRVYFQIVSSIENEEFYLISRINEDNCDVNLINKIYTQNKNITFVPSISYNYKKLPSIIQYCKNYIMLPTIFQRSDFLEINFALTNLISDGCLIFGEDTDNFIYLAKDYGLVEQEKRKNYRKISLSSLSEKNSLTNEEMNYYSNEEIYEDVEEENLDENSEKSNINPIENDSEKLIRELSNFQNQQLSSIPKEIEDNFENSLTDVEEGKVEQEAELEVVQEETEEISQAELAENTEEKDEFSNIEDPIEPTNDLVEKIEQFEAKETKEAEEIEETLELKDSQVLKEFETSKESVQIEEPIEETQQIQEVINEENILENANEKIEEQENTNQDLNKEENLKEEERRAIEGNVKEIFSKKEEVEIEEKKPEPKIEATTLEKQTQEEKTKKDDTFSSIGLSDEELDFFQMAEESEKVSAKETNIKQNEEVKQETKEETKEDDLSQVAKDSLDNSFDQLLELDIKSETPSIEIGDESLNIDLDSTINNEKLPIFTEEKKENHDPKAYKVGDNVVHNKYGKGKVVSIVPYKETQLLQIEFEKEGKKLLDPKIANIILE